MMFESLFYVLGSIYLIIKLYWIVKKEVKKL